MKKIICLFLLSILVIPFFAFGSREKTQRENEVVIYAHDSFVAEWGPGPALVELFQEKTGYTVTLISVGDAGEVLPRAVLEKKSPRADVLIGIDSIQLPQALAADVLLSYKPAQTDNLFTQTVVDPNWFLTPYDWSYFAFMYDSTSSVLPPQNLSDLTKSEYAKKIILLDPRTSSPGRGFVAWTVAVFGKDYLEFWKKLKPNILTMAPGWSTGYGLFTSAEAPLVISYTTSAPYHLEYEDTDRYKALIFPEGHITQVECAGIVKGAKNEKGAKAFMDFLISDEAQQVLPLTQWMYPANKNTVLPPSYKSAPFANTVLSVPTAEVSKAVTEVMSLLAQ